MSIFSLIGNYFLWHYSTAFINMFRIWGDFFWFVYHFFSIPVLVHTLFSPWKKIHEERESVGFNVQDIFSALVVNTIMRIIGFFFRVILIAVGMFSVVFVFVAGVVVFAVWVLAPVLILVSLISGINFLFK